MNAVIDSDEDMGEAVALDQNAGRRTSNKFAKKGAQKKMKVGGPGGPVPPGNVVQ